MGGAFLFACYVGAVIAFFAFAALPLLALGVVGAVVALAGVYVRSAVDILVRATPRRPAPVAIAPTVPATADGEPAFGQYFFGQALADLRHIVEVVKEDGIPLVKQVHRFLVDDVWESDAVVYVWPLALVGHAALVVGTTAGAAVVTALAAVQLVGVVIAQLIARLATLVLRGADSLVLQVRGISMRCPQCHRRVPYPAYECGGCQEIHRDIRPGRYGILRRICNCGVKLPTLLILGSHRLNAFCPHCDPRVPLAEHAGTTPELVVPFVGATTAGKTQLMVSMLRTLELDPPLNGSPTMVFADRETERRWPDLRDRFVDGRGTLGTQDPMPRSYLVEVARPSGPRRIVHLFDPKGELWNTDAGAQSLSYLGDSRTFVLVLDPVVAQGSNVRAGASSGPAPADPTPVLEQLVAQALRRSVPISKCRLAIVMSRWDVVREASGLPLAPSNEQVAAYIDGVLGLPGVRLAAGNQFGEVRCFAVASVAPTPSTVDPSVKPLLEWVLQGRAT